MKKVLYLVPLWLMLLNSVFYGGALVEKLEEATKKFGEAGKKIFEGGFEERRERLTALEREKSNLIATSNDFKKTIDTKIGSIERQLETVKRGLAENPDDEFLSEKQATLTECYQVLKDTQKARDELRERLEEGIKLYQDYVNDPNLGTFRKEHDLDALPPYSFEFAQGLNQSIVALGRNITSLGEQEKNATTELESRKRIVATTIDTHQKKQKELSTLGKDERNSDLFGFDIQKRADLLKLEEALYKDKIELEKIRLQSIEYKISFTKFRLFIAKTQQEMLKDMLRRVKSLIYISEADVSYARDELIKKKQKLFADKEVYSKEIERLSMRLKAKERELETLSKRFNVSLGADLDDLSRELKPNITAYISFFEVGSVNDQVLLLQRAKDLLEAQISLENEKLNYESVQIDIKGTFYKITSRIFGSEEERSKEAKKYDALKTEANANISSFKSKRDLVSDLLVVQKRALENISIRQTEIQGRQTTTFRGYDREFARVMQLLRDIEMSIAKQIDMLTQISGLYTDIITILTTTVQQIDFIIGELVTITIWGRPEHAISWEGIHRIVPDSEHFMRDIYTYFSHFNLKLFIEKAKAPFVRLPDLLTFMFKLMLLFVVLIVSRKYLPIARNFLLGVSESYHGLRALSFFIAAILGFLITYFFSIAIWLVIFLGMYFYKIPDPYLYALLYLLSIPYLIYVANRFIRYLIIFNRKEGYILLRKDFQSRFEFVFSTLLYATISILFFREAFLLISYAKSELPTMLLAVNFIIFQIAIIFLIDKEQILDLIPTKNELWEWIRTQVDNYYYLILVFFVAVIVMSNPYVGFGQLVLFVLTRLVYTIILIRLLFWGQSVLKKVSSSIFFSTRDEVVRERFLYAKTWYGVFVILFFFGLLFLGVIVGARIWGWPEALTKITRLEDVIEWLKTPVLYLDRESPISVYMIVQLLIFIGVGIIVAFAVNRFVFGRVFDVLTVDPGVQNTVTSISRYLIIITVLILGFHSVGLSSLVVYLIGALVLSIGWVIKDPISDFIAYFIILVQRPIKIGDYIKIDEETRGVVRKITPRSVVLRRKNSIIIIVPNSVVINKSLINWNYTPGFIAFDDIIVTIPYKYDPEFVRSLFLEVLEGYPYILKSPKPIVRLDDFGEYGFYFMVRGYVSSNYTLDQWDIASNVRLAIVKKLREHNITIAVPIRILRQQSNNDVQEYLDVGADKK